MLAEVVEGMRSIPRVDHVEGQVVEVRVALVHERHHVVVGVDVEPDPVAGQPVRDPHAETSA